MIINKCIKNIFTITLITVISGISLSFIYQKTEKPIKQIYLKRLNKSYKKIFVNCNNFEEYKNINKKDLNFILRKKGYKKERINKIIIAKKDSNVLGYIFDITTKEGFNGDIQLLCGINNTGKVLSIDILKISETPGLGMKAKEKKFYSQFENKKTNKFTYKKQDNKCEKIDSISGATITTNAITNAVNSAIVCFLYIIR